MPPYTTWEAHLQETAAWLLKRSKTPGCREYAKHERDKLLAHPFYGQSLRDELDRQQSTPLSTPPDGVPCEQS